MKNRFWEIFKKLTNKKGESLPEVLGTIIIVALAVTGVLSASQVTRNIMNVSEGRTQEIYEEVEGLDLLITSDKAADPEIFREKDCTVNYDSNDAHSSTEYQGYTPYLDYKETLNYGQDRLYAYRQEEIG